MDKQNQKTTVLNHLKKHGSISSWQAISKYRITRLAAVILLLRKDGHSIKSVKRIRNGKNWVDYHYEPKTVQTNFDF